MFDYYSGVSDLVQHLRHFWDKMMVYSYNDPLLYLTFPSCLKSVISYWFYSLLPYSLHNFEEVIEAFSLSTPLVRTLRGTTTTFHRQDEAKCSLKSYIGYFHSYLAKVPNCDDDISALVFISRLQISYPLHKRLKKHNVNRMSEVLSQDQTFIQLEKVMKIFANHSTKRGDDGEE